MTTLTSEAMLQAVIERQCAGGYRGWEFIGDPQFDVDTGRVQCLSEYYNSLEILLDPAGLKAAYGENLPCHICELYKQNPDRTDEGHGCISGTWRDVARSILHPWLETSSPEETIKTAFSLLPTV